MQFKLCILLKKCIAMNKTTNATSPKSYLLIKFNLKNKKIIYGLMKVYWNFISIYFIILYLWMQVFHKVHDKSGRD